MAREIIKMESTESPYFYTTTKNKRKTTEKLTIMGYDPYVRRKVKFKEGGRLK